MTANAGGRVTDECDCRDDLSLRDAARHYEVSVATLRRQVRSGQVPAYKVRGPWGQEWRVSHQAVGASGYAVRPVEPDPEDPHVATLRRELGVLRRVVAVERNRADQADRELGQAMLECGRLRSALARAHTEPARCPDCVRGDGATSTAAARASPDHLGVPCATTGGA